MSAPLYNWLVKRGAGLLLHPTSLPGEHGVGTMGASLRRFIDFLGQSGITYWQMLPPGPTGYGDCPYSSFSSFAGNPYLIDLDELVRQGLLARAELVELERLPRDHVDFGQLYKIKWAILRLAHKRFAQSKRDVVPGYGSFRDFKAASAAWLEPFAFFMALKAQHGGRPWYEWEAGLRSWERAQGKTMPKAVRDEAEAQRFYQYIFFGQWKSVREWAATAGVTIVGDMPFYVARDSADVWASPEVFDLDADLAPVAVAGVPPDYFTPDGQLWGNPIYRWEHLKATGYKWWLDRLGAGFEIFDIVRLDHFRAFHNYWRVPAGAPNARKGDWILGPGLDFFEKVLERFPASRIIAEDLGDIDPGVYELLAATGLPGMAVLQFAFDGDPSNLHITHNHKPNQVVYPGTHDNDTVRGWYAEQPGVMQDQIRRYMRISGEDISWDLIRESYRSPARLAIVAVQDLLCLGPEGRMNKPGTAMGNWQWRMTHEQFERLLSHTPALKELGWLYGRAPAKKKAEKTDL
jgi:4-alpha-glucanotransferase